MLPGKVLEIEFDYSFGERRRYGRRVFIVNGLATLLVLINTGLGEFMSASALSFAVVGAAVAGSFLWFRRLHRAGIHVQFIGRLRWAHRQRLRVVA